jgi:carbon storage regulator
MLVLSRGKGERVMIGDDIVVSILTIIGDRVRIGIEAPRHVSVHREEVFDALKRQKAAPEGERENT